MQERCQDTTHVKAEPLVPDAPEVEILLQQALEVARRQHAQSLELRAAMPLSRLWQQMGQRAARELLDRLTRVPPKQRGGTHGARQSSIVGAASARSVRDTPPFAVTHACASPYTGGRPCIRRITRTTTAITSKRWMKPPGYRRRPLPRATTPTRSQSASTACAFPFVVVCGQAGVQVQRPRSAEMRG